MSLQPKTKNKRVLSARVTQVLSERVRPLSGISNYAYTRRQMIETVYNSQGSDINRIQSARPATVNILSQNYQVDKPFKKMSGKQTKQKEEMASQIFGLKQTVNRLVQQLSLQRGKLENMRKKNIKYSKILTIEFEDEKQWGSNAVNTHLVTGIKNMYDSLKQKYEAKCNELDRLIKKESVTREMENEIYTKALEGEVKDLKKRMEKMDGVNIGSVFISQTHKYANEHVILDLQKQINLLEEKNKVLQKKYQQILQSYKQDQLKIQLDKKLIGEKDNNLHALQRKNKQLSKQISKIKESNLLLGSERDEFKQSYQKQAQSLKQYVTGYQQKCRIQVESANKNHQSKIQSLELDNSYLLNMIQELRLSNMQLNKINQQLKIQSIKHQPGINVHHLDNHNQEKFINTKRQPKKADQSIIHLPYHNGKRIPQKADKKYRQNAIKTRKIQLIQVLQIAELLRLKLIAQYFPIEEVKKLFDWKVQDSKQSQDTQWEKQYINMAEVKSIFRKSPFSLQQYDSVIISRYLIEDIQQEYVYCDDLNQNHRQVVKSIIKTLIQQYPTYTKDSPEYCKMNEAIHRYGSHLKSALENSAKAGSVSKATVLEAMKGIGMEIQPVIFEVMISKMALKSKKLNSLDYKYIF